MSECNQCGRCCMNTLGANDGRGLSVSENDLRRWRSVSHPALNWYCEISNDIWINPRTGDEWRGRQCPWLRKISEGKYRCEIYLMRPDTCREWIPINRKQADRVGCCITSQEEGNV